MSGIQFANVQIDGETKALGGSDPAKLPQLINVDVVAGDITDMDHGVAVSTFAADDFDPPLQLGDELTVTFQNGTEVQLPVVALYGDNALAGDWNTANAILDANTSGQRSMFFVPIKLAPGVTPEAGVEAITAALADDYPQTEVQTAEEFKDAQAAQINPAAGGDLRSARPVDHHLGARHLDHARPRGVRTHPRSACCAVGMTKRQTRRMVRWEAIIVSLFGAVIGIVLGTLIGIALTAALPDEFVSSVTFDPTTIVIILVGAIVAGVIAALYPSAKASRLDVLEAIATE